MNSTVIRMEKDTARAIAQNAAENLLLLANVAEKYGNNDHWHEAPERTPERQPGVTPPRKRKHDARRNSDKEMHERPSKPAKQTKRNEASGSRPPLIMPIEFKEKIKQLRGDKVKMMIEKELTKTDLSQHCNRLSIPEGQMWADLLDKEDQENLEKRTEDRKHCEGMEVQLIEPNLSKSNISLKKWKIGKSTSYILCNTWRKVVENNGLKAGDTIQVWSFKVDGSLGLAIVRPQN